MTLRNKINRRIFVAACIITISFLSSVYVALNFFRIPRIVTHLSFVGGITVTTIAAFLMSSFKCPKCGKRMQTSKKGWGNPFKLSDSIKVGSCCGISLDEEIL